MSNSSTSRTSDYMAAVDTQLPADLMQGQRQLDHIGIVVDDIDAATYTYRDLMGFKVTGGEDLPARGITVRFVDAGHSRIELIAPTRADSEVSSFLAKRGSGIHHVCVAVPDLEATLAKLKSNGVRLIDETPKAGAHGTKVAFVHPKAAHGVLIEFVEHPHVDQQSPR